MSVEKISTTLDETLGDIGTVSNGGPKIPRKPSPVGEKELHKKLSVLLTQLAEVRQSCRDIKDMVREDDDLEDVHVFVEDVGLMVTDALEEGEELEVALGALCFIGNKGTLSQV